MHRFRRHAWFGWWVITAIVVMAPAVTVSAAVTEWVDMKIENGLITVATKISGIGGNAMFDTGAQINGINSRFLKANELEFSQGPKMGIVGVFGTEQRKTYTKVPVDIFGTTIDLKGLVDLNVGPPDRQLLIGAGFFENFVVQIDYPNQRMRLITRDSIDLKRLKNVESKRDPDGGGSPLVKVRLNDQRDVWLIMDTGSNGGVLIDRPVAKKFKWLEQYPVTSGISWGATAGGQMDRFVLPKLTFGGFEIGNPTVSVPAAGQDMELFKKEGNTGSRIRKGRGRYQGLLGFDVLKHFVVTIDYKRGHVHVAPPE